MKKTNRLSIDELKAKWSNVEITQNLELIVGGSVADECHNGDCRPFYWPPASPQ